MDLCRQVCTAFHQQTLTHQFEYSKPTHCDRLMVRHEPNTANLTPAKWLAAYFEPWIIVGRVQLAWNAGSKEEMKQGCEKNC